MTIGSSNQQSATAAAYQLTGSFSQNPDGTGTLKLNAAADSSTFGLTFATVASEGGKTLALLATECRSGNEGCNLNGTIFSGVAQVAGSGSVSGTYGFQNRHSPIPTAHVGIITFDGNGGLTWSATTVNPGRDDNSGQAPRSTSTFTGTYTVNPDGTGSVNLINAQGQPGPIFALVSVGENSLMMLQTNRTDRNVRFGTAQRR